MDGMTKCDGQLTPGQAAWLVSEFQRKLREPITDDLERLIAEICERNMQKFAENYAKAYPGEKFAVKRVGPGQFNIVSVGEDTAWQN